MDVPEPRSDAVDVIATLGDGVRRSLYDYVVSRGTPVGRDEAADAVGIKRPLAAYHLDRLARDGLLDIAFARPGGRTGPGAGRPAKLYHRSGAELEVSLPPRRYELAAELLASALDAPGASRARASLTAQ